MTNFWDMTSQDYDSRHETPYMSYLRRRELGVIKRFARGKILDLGCGTGFPLLELERLGYIVFGIDSSIDSLKILKNKKPSAKVVLAEASRLPFKGPFDTMVSTLSLINYIEKPEQLLEELKNLSKDSCLIFSIAGNWDRGLVERLKLKGAKRRKILQIHRHKTKTILFGSQHIIKIFKEFGFKLSYYRSLFLFTELKWGSFQPLKIRERVCLFLERIFSRYIEGRVHLLVFEK